MTADKLVLVVDDDQDIRDVMVEMLEDHGYTAVGAANGRHALDLLSEGLRPGLVLLDLMMPVMDGQTFVEELHRSPLARIPIIVLSAHRDADQNLAVAAHLRKPVDAKTLLKTVRQQLG